MTLRAGELDPVLALRAGMLYIPLALALLLAALRWPQRRAWGGVLLASLWNFELLSGLSVLAPRFGWWTFHASGAMFLGMPFDVLLGWVILWGLIPLLAFPKMRLAYVAAIFLAFDLVCMPRLRPVLVLGQEWMVGEMLALLIAFLPSLFLARATRDATHLRARVLMQVAVFSGLIVVVIPAAIFANTSGDPWHTLSRPPWVNGILLQLLAPAAILGLSAVQEFADRGEGTPLPYDPPGRLVTSGPYAYVANPMQIAGVLLLSGWGLFLGSWWVAASGLMAHIYSAGLATWDESEDVSARFGEAWPQYRRRVRNWIPRWQPWHASVADARIPRATLYVSETCGPCSEVKAWFERQSAVGLVVVAAESYPGEALTRITYVAAPDAEPEAGIAALARAVEHIHLGWAMVSFTVRLPVVLFLVQLIADSSGAGPRNIGKGVLACGNQ